MTASVLESLLARAESLLARLEARFPAPATAPDWTKIRAARWLSDTRELRPISHPHRISAGHLFGIEEQKDKVDANTRQFIEGRPANNILLTDSRGTGKSSLVKAMLSSIPSRSPCREARA
jgi:predicted AAA+ superfamily ATPase